MRYLIWIETLKLFKKKWFCLALLLIPIIVPLVMAFRVKSNFVFRYENWARLSRDPNPYNFLVNNASWYTSITTLLCLVLWGYAISSTEYKKNIVDKIITSGEGLKKIFYLKTAFLAFLGLVSFAISLLTFYLTFKSFFFEHERVFKGYAFLNTLEQLMFLGLNCLCIFKVAAFHHVIIALAKKHYYIPIIIGVLSIFFFLRNLLPYGMYYRTYQDAFLFQRVVVYNFIGFSVVMVLYFVFFNEKIQKRLKRMQQSI